MNNDVVTTAQLHYTVDGPEDAPALVLGSSLGTTTALWDAQIPELARDFRVIRYDHRGHGRSPVPTPPYSLVDLGGDVLAVMDRLGIVRAHVAGTSLGGMVSIWVAAHAPERVNRLAVLCTSAKLGPPEVWIQRAAMVRSRGLEAIADAVIGRWLTPEFAERNPSVVAHYRDMLTATPVEGYVGCCDAIQEMDLEPDLHRVTAPTLVIAGLADEATPPTHAQRIASRIEGSRLALVAGAAHLANVTRPDLVTQLLIEFLKEST